MAEAMQVEVVFTDPLTQQNPQSCPDLQVKWSHAAVILLIESYREHMHLLNDPSKRKVDVWRMIAQDLEGEGNSFTPGQCQKKMDNLKSRFKIIKDRNRLAGRAHDTWYYFDLMEDLMCRDPTVTYRPRGSVLTGRKIGSSGHLSHSSTPALARLASRKRPFDRNFEPPPWFKDYVERQERLLTRLVDAIEKKNVLMEDLLKKL